VVWLLIWVVSGLVEWGSPWVSMSGGHTGLGGIGTVDLCWPWVIFTGNRMVLVPVGNGTGVVLVPPRLVSEIQRSSIANLTPAFLVI